MVKLFIHGGEPLNMDTEPEDRALLTIMALSVLGLIDSLYLTYLHHLVAGGGGCPTQNLPGLDCGEVLASEQAELLGIPVAWFGVLGFIALFSLALAWSTMKSTMYSIFRSSHGWNN